MKYLRPGLLIASFFVLLLLSWKPSVPAADIVFEANRIRPYLIGANIQVLEDAEKQLTIEKILTPAINQQFTPTSASIPTFQTDCIRNPGLIIS